MERLGHRVEHLESLVELLVDAGAETGVLRDHPAGEHDAGHLPDGGEIGRVKQEQEGPAGQSLPLGGVEAAEVSSAQSITAPSVSGLTRCS